MGLGKSRLLLCIGHRSVGILEFASARADRSGQVSVETRVAKILRIPGDVDPSSTRDFGAWLGASLDQIGCRTKSATLVLERSDVVAKRLSLEGIERGDVDLPGLVRYQLMRQVAFQSDDAPMDFMLLHPKAKSLKDVSGDAEVLAATAPAARVAHLREVCDQAGLDIQRVAVLSLGLGEIAESAMADRVGPTLVIAPTLDGIDYSIHQAGRTLSSRWIETQHRTSEQDLSELIVSEARRTRMGHQLAPESDPIHSALIIAEPGGVLGDTETLAHKVGDVLGVLSEVIDPRSQNWLTLKGEWESDRLIGLIGLITAAVRCPSGSSGQMHQIDLAHPITPADKGAATRQLVLAAILLLIVSLGAMRSFAGMKLREADAEIQAMQESRSQVTQTYHAAIRDHAAAEFVQRWRRSGGSPLEHLDLVVSVLPSNEAVLLKSFSWSLQPVVDYPRQRGRSDYDPSNWAQRAFVSVGVDLLAKSREVADTTRRAFVEQPIYIVETAGPDGAQSNNSEYPERLELRMRSTVSRPAETDSDGLASVRSGGAGS